MPVWPKRVFCGLAKVLWRQKIPLLAEKFLCEFIQQVVPLILTEMFAEVFLASPPPGENEK